MYKIAFLGSENSHALSFAKIIKEDESYRNVEIVGAYGLSEEANDALKEYGVNYFAKSPDEFKDKVDAVLITARHGDNHLKYAEPYFESGIPMFIDKPLTISEEEALTLVRKAKANGSVLSGGSMLKTVCDLKEIKSAVAPVLKEGQVVSGSVSAPLFYKENCGGFFFYSQHLAEMVLEVFGADILSVKAFGNPDKAPITAILRYKDFDVSAHFGTGDYTVTAYTKNDALFKRVDIEKDGFKFEFEDFMRTVRTKKQELSYEKLVRPVFVLNAIYRSMISGNEEKVNKFEI